MQLLGAGSSLPPVTLCSSLTCQDQPIAALLLSEGKPCSNTIGFFVQFGQREGGEGELLAKPLGVNFNIIRPKVPLFLKIYIYILLFVQSKFTKELVGNDL